MTQIIINNTPEDYFDVLNTDNFSLKRERELNWLERSDRNKNKIQKVPPFRKILEEDSDE